MAPLYTENEDFSLAIRKLTALAFVPVDDVQQIFLELDTNKPVEAAPIYSYFREFYIDGHRGGRGRPRYVMFLPRTWNCRERTLDGDPRTNNNIEVWHRHLNVIMGRRHPNLFDFLSVLRQEQAATEKAIEHRLAGNPFPIRKLVFRQRDETSDF